MVKRRLIPFGVLSLTLVLLLVPLCRAGWQIRQNRQIAGKFQPRTDSPYLLHIPVEEMDLSVYDPYFSIPMAAISLPTAFIRDMTSKAIRPMKKTGGM